MRRRFRTLYRRTEKRAARVLYHYLRAGNVSAANRLGRKRIRLKPLGNLENLARRLYYPLGAAGRNAPRLCRKREFAEPHARRQIRRNFKRKPRRLALNQRQICRKPHPVIVSVVGARLFRRLSFREIAREPD